MHFRESLEALNQVELDLAQTALYDFLELRQLIRMFRWSNSASTNRRARATKPRQPMTASPSSRRSGTRKLPHRSGEDLTPWLHAFFPAVPDAKYLTFYPMDRKRGEGVNWYTVPFAERQRMMHEHGLIGRRYGDQVKQIISGSIGMDRLGSGA